MFLSNWFHSTFDLSDEDRVKFAFGLWVVPTLTFWIGNLFIYLITRYNVFPQYKVHTGLQDSNLFNQAFVETFINHFIIRPFVSFALYDLFKAFGAPSIDSPPPTPLNFIGQIILCLFVTDALFYWSHRLLHHRYLYKYFHKKHHEFRLVNAIGCEYAGILETLTSNIGATIAAPLLLGYHPYVLFAWIFLRESCTLDVHCGYNFPFSFWRFVPFNQGGPQRHDFHHAKNTGNFGEFLVFWDWLCGTDETYNKRMSEKKSE